MIEPGIVGAIGFLVGALFTVAFLWILNPRGHQSESARPCRWWESHRWSVWSPPVRTFWSPVQHRNCRRCGIDQSREVGL